MQPATHRGPVFWRPAFLLAFLFATTGWLADAQAQQARPQSSQSADVAPPATPGAVAAPATPQVKAHGDRPTLSSRHRPPLYVGRGGVLYQNGPLFNSPGTGVGGADESILETGTGGGIYGYGAQNDLGNIVADDFTVPSGETWTVDQLVLYAYQTGSTTTSTITGVFVEVYDGNPAAGGTVIFGDQTTNVLESTQWSGVYRVEDGAGCPSGSCTQRPIMEVVADVNVELTEGTYWIAYSFLGNAAFSGPWAPPVATTGACTAGNGQQSIAGVWAPLANGTCPLGDELPFQVIGTSGGGGGDEVTITHSTSQAIDPGIGIACGVTGLYTTENSVWRVFDLSEFPEIVGTFDVTSVDFGIEEATINGGPLPSTVNLYTLDGPFTTANLTLVSSAPYGITDADDLTIVNVPITGSFTEDDVLVVEWFYESGEATGSFVYFGGNAAPETGPTYLSSVSCTLPEPTDLAALGFPENNWVLNVNGITGGGGGGGSDFSVSPDSLSFEVPIGSVSDPQTLTLTNNGTDPGTFTVTTVVAPLGPLAPPAPPAQAASRPRVGNPAKLLDGPMPPTPGTPYFGGDIVQDGSFEAGTPNPVWEEGSTNFGTPLCDPSLCGTGGGTGPHTGNWWAWFGGIPGVVESGFIEQDVTIPAGTATLSFWLEIPVAGTTGFLSVQLDGDEVFRVTEADQAAYAVYTEVMVDISAYADGGTHALRFESTTDAGADALNFFVDDVSITVEGGPPPGGLMLVVDPENGTVAPGDSQEITVIADATDAPAVGTYTGEVRIETDDPDTPLLVVPVTIEVTDPIAIEGGSGLPTSFSVSAPYPNPASGLTALRYALPEAAHVRVEVYDVTGRRVALLVDEEQRAAFHEVSWDAGALATGLYVCRVQAGDHAETVKVVVAR